MADKITLKITADEALNIIDWQERKFITVANLKNYPGKEVYSKFLTRKIQTQFGVKITIENGHYWKKKVSLYANCLCGTKFKAETKGYMMKEGKELEFDIHRPEVLANKDCKCCKNLFFFCFFSFP